MKKSLIETVMFSFIKQGLKINTIRSKMRRFATQSTLCKMYHKLITESKTITVIKHCTGLFTVVKSNHAAIKCGGMFEFMLIQRVEKYGLKLVIL